MIFAIIAISLLTIFAIIANIAPYPATTQPGGCRQMEQTMILKGYDENGELAFKQGPFTFWVEGLQMFEDEKKEAVAHGIFCLVLENEHAKDPRNRIVASFCR